MAVFIRIAAARSVPRAKAHVRYIAFRSRELPGEERCAFDARSDRAHVRTFLAGLDDPVNRHPMAAKAYKLVLSLSGDEFAQAGLTSWKPVVREAMANLEARWGMKLDWIAAEHLNADHPHCHLVIRASYADCAGRRRQLRINREQLAELKAEYRRIIARERRRHRELERTRPERDGGREGADRDPWRTALMELCRAIERDVAESERQAQREQERQRRRRPRREAERGR